MFEVFKFTKLEAKPVLCFEAFDCTLGDVELKIRRLSKGDLPPCLIYPIDLFWREDRIESHHEDGGK